MKTNFFLLGLAKLFQPNDLTQPIMFPINQAGLFFRATVVHEFS